MKGKTVVFILIAFIGSFWAWFVNDQNIRFLNESGDHTYQGMVETADDASYIQPAYNYSRSGIWKDNSTGLSSYIQRPPAIGFITLCLKKWFPGHFYGAHKFVALLLHLLALLVFAFTVNKLAGYKTAIFLQSLYALVPCFWGYLFYHLTESLTPSLLVLLTYGYVMYHAKPHPRWLIYQSILVSVLLLMRPQLAVFTFPFVYFLSGFIKRFSGKRLAILLACFVLAFGGFISWQVRNTIIAQKLHAENWAGIHPIYSVTNTSQYRPVHRSLGELFKIWEPNSAEFHTLATALFEQGISVNGIDTVRTKQLAESVHTRNCTGIDRQKLFYIFIRYESVLQENRYVYLSHRPLLKETSSEEKLRRDIDELTSTLKKRNVFLCYFKTPARSALFMFSKSQLNLLLFQTRFRGMWWMETLRCICVAGIAVFSLFFILQLTNRDRFYVLLAVCFILYLFYLFFIQKMNEERYLMPWLPVILIFGYHRIHSFIKSRYI